MRLIFPRTIAAWKLMPSVVLRVGQTIIVIKHRRHLTFSQRPRFYGFGPLAVVVRRLPA